MSHVLALDPGIVHPAAALFEDKQLVLASRVKLPKDLTKLPRAARCLAVAKVLLCWLPQTKIVRLDYVFEWPQKYAGSKSKGDPADLFPLAGVGMALAGLLDGRVDDLHVHDYLPREWAGNTSKATSGDPLASPRGVRVWSRLGLIERQNLVVSHDAVDAVGIGLKFLDRFERVQSFIGATRDE